MKTLLAFFLLFIAGLTMAYANDSAVETAAGGIKLRKEQSVLMKKERLFISEKLVRVEYEFLNTTDKPISSEVAFPIPPYSYQYDDLDRNFKSFKAWVNGKPIEVKKDIHAFVNGHEVTDDLNRAGVTIDDFGGFDPENHDNEIVKLTPEVRDELVKVGILQAPAKKDYPPEYWPLWETHLTYYWHQEFPPGKIVHIKHEYEPVIGYMPLHVDELKDACLDARTINEINKRIALRKESLEGDDYIYPIWVSYILTTANTWQTPIKDFALTVQREKGDLVAFCWDGPVEKISDTQFRARQKDFVPTRELKVYFLKNPLR